MIGKLKGIVDSYGPDWIIVDVHGVGYLVHCSSHTLAQLPGAGEATVIAIETYVREQEIRLFGFSTDVEREWFRLLLTVQGVGTRVALAVLSTLRPSELAAAIATQDKAMIARTPGVGPRVGQRICTELKDKVPAISGVAGDPISEIFGDTGVETVGTPESDAVSALINLGYSQAQAMAAVAVAVREVDEDKAADAASLIRRGLRELAG